MKHLDLFSGIGGFALAASRVWGESHEIASFCEIDPFCQKVLQKNFPNIYIHDDIKTLSGFDFRGIDLITGGFPCQPFSVAGKQRSKADDRYLWGEMFRVISEASPRWIVAENVAGIIKLALDDVLSDLESANYTAQAVVIPACAVGAPHKRERVWIIAHTDREREQQPQGAVGEVGRRLDDCIEETFVTYTDRAPTKHTVQAGRNVAGSVSQKEIITDTESAGFQDSPKRQRQGKPRGSNSRDIWERMAFEPPLCGANHGLSNRVDRIKSLGNAIVPQVAEEILQAIKEVDLLFY